MGGRSHGGRTGGREYAVGANSKEKRRRNQQEKKLGQWGWGSGAGAAGLGPYLHAKGVDGDRDGALVGQPGRQL